MIMKFKFILPFIVSMIFFSFTRLHSKGQELVVLKQQLPYEITDVKVSSSTLTIEGWAFINENQHFLNENTHSTFIEFTSKNDRFRVKARSLDKDMSGLMRYAGARLCRPTEYYKAASFCNYSYKNVGFILNVPLDMFHKEETYTAMLIVHAKQTNTTYKIQLFYPLKNPIINQVGDYQFKLTSAMKDTKLIINHQNVVVRSGPTQAYPIIALGSYCSKGYTNKLFYQHNQVFSNIIDKRIINGISIYRLKGDVLGCVDLKKRVKEGSSIDPMYIASTFVEYSGTMLSISNTLINQGPELFVRAAVINVDDPFNYTDYVSAYDYEEKDLSEKIQVVSSNYQNKIGHYQVVVYVCDKYGYSDQQTIKVTVKGPKNTAPTLVVQDRTLKQFSTFNPLDGVFANDKEDGNLSDKIKTSNQVTTDQVGEFSQCYLVEDSKQALASACAKITVIKQKQTISHRFLKKNISALTHISWQHFIRELSKQLENQVPLLE